MSCLRHNRRVNQTLGTDEIQAARERLERLAWLLDGCIEVPGTRWRIGVESILGMVPVVGDALGLLAGGAIMYEAMRLGAPGKLQARMAGNLLIDTLAGSVPVAGDLFDFAFKANRRNAELLRRHLDQIEGVVDSRHGRHLRLSRLGWLLAVLAVVVGAALAFVALQ